MLNKGVYGYAQTALSNNDAQVENSVPTYKPNPQVDAGMQSAGEYAIKVTRLPRCNDIETTGDFIIRLSKRIIDCHSLREFLTCLGIPCHAVEGALTDNRYNVQDAAESLLSENFGGQSYDLVVQKFGAALGKAGQIRLASELCQIESGYVMQTFAPDAAYPEITEQNASLERIIFEVSKHIAAWELITKLCTKLQMSVSQVHACQSDYSKNIELAAFAFMRKWVAMTGNDNEAKNALRAALLRVGSGYLRSGINAQLFKPVSIDLSKYSANNTEKDRKDKNTLIEDVSKRISNYWMLWSLANSLDIPCYITAQASGNNNDIGGEVKKLLIGWFADKSYEATKHALRTASIESGQKRLTGDLYEKDKSDACVRVFREGSGYSSITNPKTNLMLYLLSLGEYVVSDSFYRNLGKALGVEGCLVKIHRLNNLHDFGSAAYQLLRTWYDNTDNDAAAKESLRPVLEDMCKHGFILPYPEDV